MDARKGAWKHNQGTIVISWQEDDKYRTSQQAHGWTEEHCRYLDYLTTIDIAYTALLHQRHRYEGTITLVCNDEDRQAGPTKARRDFKTHYENSRKFSTRTRTTELLHSEARENEAKKAIR